MKVYSEHRTQNIVNNNKHYTNKRNCDWECVSSDHMQTVSHK